MKIVFIKYNQQYTTWDDLKHAHIHINNLHNSHTFIFGSNET